MAGRGAAVLHRQNHGRAAAHHVAAGEDSRHRRLAVVVDHDLAALGDAAAVSPSAASGSAPARWPPPLYRTGMRKLEPSHRHRRGAPASSPARPTPCGCTPSPSRAVLVAKQRDRRGQEVEVRCLPLRRARFLPAARATRRVRAGTARSFRCPCACAQRAASIAELPPPTTTVCFADADRSVGMSGNLKASIRLMRVRNSLAV